MPDTIPTMRVVAHDPLEQGPFVIINADDFDASIHTEFTGPDEAAVPEAAPVATAPELFEGLTKAEICADLAAMNVDFDTRATKAELLALRNEARAIRDA